MKILKTKSEITGKILKLEDCEFKGIVLGYNKKKAKYFTGRIIDRSVIEFFEKISELKDVLV